MICPNCGFEMKDEDLYCENCGQEIHIVPLFEPEIEQSITDNLSNIEIQPGEYNGYGDEYSDAEFVEGQSDEEYYAEDGQYADEYEGEEYPEEGEYSDEYEDQEYAEDEYSEELPEDEYSEEEYSDEEYDEEYYEDEYDEEYSDRDYSDDDYDDEDDDFDEEFSADPFDDFEYESELIKKFIEFMRNSRAKWLIIAGIAVVFIAIGVLVFLGFNKIRKANSIDYQYQQAMEAAMDGDYDTAIKYLDKAISLDPDDYSKKLLLADYYFKNNNPDSAILTLWEVIRGGGDTAASAYEKMVEYYASLQDYAMINTILKDCNITSVLDEYQEYLALEPTFSQEEGTYDDIVTLELSSNTNGTIYYTTDGSEPNESSQVYTVPIVMEDLGQHTINAYFVNSYGIKSDVIKKSYLIDIVQPNAPNVLLESGTYDFPIPIEVDVQRYCDVYYTTDGTPPNLNSLMYESPIYMPIGSSHFIFVAFSQESKQGDITECDYNLNIDSEVDFEEVYTKLLAYDLLTGKSVDMDGHMAASTTKYNYTITNAITYNKDGSLFLLDHGQEGIDVEEDEKSDVEKAKEVELDDIEIYFIVTEAMVDVYGNSMKTGTYYLVDTEEGKIYMTGKDDEGILTKGEEIDPNLMIAPVAPQPDPGATQPDGPF